MNRSKVSERFNLIRLLNGKTNTRPRASITPRSASDGRASNTRASHTHQHTRENEGEYSGASIPNAVRREEHANHFRGHRHDRHWLSHHVFQPDDEHDGADGQPNHPSAGLLRNRSNRHHGRYSWEAQEFNPGAERQWHCHQRGGNSYGITSYSSER